MISVKDRAPLHPGRVQLNPVTGQPNIFDLMRADNPTEVGTALNRRTMQLLQADIRTLPVAAGNTVAAGDVVDVVGGAIDAGKRAVGGLAVGTIIKMSENGVPVDYIVVHQGLPSALYDGSCNGTWVLRKDILESRAWHSSAVNDYANSTIKPYLDSTVLNLFDTTTKAAIKQVKIPYRPGTSGAAVNSGANGLSCRVFLLGAYEVGWTTSVDSRFPIDGAKLSYFESGTTTSANTKRALASGWLRSPRTDGATDVFAVTASGSYDGNPASLVYGVRPALILDSTFVVKAVPTSQAIAIQSGSAGQSIDIIFDGVAELPGITAGAQITSAGVQGYAPQNGWLWVRPEWDNSPTGAAYGSYTGQNSDYNTSRLINLGFKPDVVVVTLGATSNLSPKSMYILVRDSNILELKNGAYPAFTAPLENGYVYIMDIADSGFLVGRAIDVIGKPYKYMALKM